MRPRTIWTSVVEQTERARRGGALQRIVTRFEVVEDRGIPFVVHILAAAERKLAALGEQERTGHSPFLPPDPDLMVHEISPTHLCLLNKFNVIDHHMLIVTKEHRDQEELLTLADFEALATCMAEIDGLGFYNAGAAAGASQPHKHLQLIPLPLGPGRDPTPIDRAVTATSQETGLTRITAFPFLHDVILLDGAPLQDGDAPALLDSYHSLLGTTGINAPSIPYNLLLTRRWMLLVPRAAEHFEGISINALGYAGSILVRDRRQLDLVRRLGPMAALRSVARSPA